jgi:hypothetical protein
MKLYRYTLLKQDGSVEGLGVSKKKTFQEFYQILHCSIIEHIPHAYYPDNLGHVEMWGDEEARLKEGNTRNPHFKVLIGNPALGEPKEWDVVGDIIKEESQLNKVN